jgi:flagellar biosynthetic protein FliO
MMDHNSLFPSYLRLLVFFPLVILLIFVVLRFIFQRITPANQRGSRIYVVERAMIASKTLLLVVKVGDEYILLSSGTNGVTFLKELGRDWEEAPWPPEEGSGNKFMKFEDVFTSIRNKLSGKS